MIPLGLDADSPATPTATGMAVVGTSDAARPESPDNAPPSLRTGLRPAHGSKFNLIIDSYMYAMAKSGCSTDAVEHADHAWLAILESPTLLDDLMMLATAYHFSVRDLGMTSDELRHVQNSEAVVVVEDRRGVVEVEYFDNSAHAWALYTDLMDREHVTASTSAYRRVVRRLDARGLPAFTQ